MGRGSFFRRATWVTFLTASTIAVLWPRTSAAQLAPTGTHYAGRARDTGHGGVQDGGGYSAAIPLDLPPSRGGLPIPVQIVSGARGFGAAGLGWEVPLSFVHVDRSYERRRPAMAPGSALSPRERISVSLPGRRAEMLPRTTPQGPEWIGRDAADLFLREQNGAWTLFDGNGFTYTFTQDPLLFGTGGPGSGGLWLLSTIKGPGGASVVLTYDIKSINLPDAPAPALAIDLVRVSYNAHPSSAGCFKNTVELAYAIPLNPQAQSLSMIGDRVMMRDHRLAAIDVMSRASCTATPKRLRRYSFTYQTDPDTQQERLASVRMLGREGTPDASVSLPIADYTYGSATSISGTARVLRYYSPQAIALPFGTGRIAKFEAVSAPDFQPPAAASVPTTKSSAATQHFIDVSGDGRPDLVYKQSAQLVVARNVAGPAGSTQLSPTSAPFNDNTFTRPVMDARSSTYDRFSAPPNSINAEDVWTQAIDVNGDGRLDMVDAAEKPYHWIVYLNTPDPGPSGIKWVRRAYNITNLYNDFTQRGLVGNGAGYVPLSRRTTGRDYGKWTCWKWEGTKKDGKYVVSTNPVNFTDPSAACYVSAQETLALHPERSWTEWEFRDLNGDGYPDVVFNSSPVRYVSGGPPKGYVGWELANEERFTLGPIVLPNPVRAVLNVRGLFISSDLTSTATDPFSAPQVLIQNSTCGVARWQTGTNGTPDQKNVSLLECGLADLNGDGLTDRIENIEETLLAYNSALLGNGFGFGTVRVKLPAELGRQENDYHELCEVNQANWYVSEQTLGLRDLTGDGIPDFIERTTATSYRVHIGTGAGFTAPVAIEGGFEISRGDNYCYGFTADTRGGLYDIDGDGIPERLTVSADFTSLHVWKLAGGSGAGVPEAGRLLEINDGYGAKTTITYRSAKEDANTVHQVPSPEIVVTAIETTGTKGLGGTLAKTHYAYGSIEVFYDSMLDAFRTNGYRRRVQLTSYPGARGATEARAQIFDRYPLDPVSTVTLPFMTDQQRFGRYLRAGRPRDVTILAGSINGDVWSLLTVDTSTDPRRIAGSQQDIDTSDARLFTDTTVPTNDVCKDIMFPYDYDLSLGNNPGSYKPCSARGFLFTKSLLSWRGTAAPPSAENVQTLASVRSVDDFGRVTSVYPQNDAFRTDDDYCIDTTYAAPTGVNERVLSAVSSMKVWNCGPEGGVSIVYAEEAWLYDKLPQGLVSQGLVTARIVYRRTTDTGTLLGNVREFDADYDAAGNPWRIVKWREDGATRTITLGYDEFGVAILQTSVNGTNVPTLSTSHNVDLVSNEVLSITDERGVVHRTTFDGFGRALSSAIVTSSGDPLGVLATRTYLGFDGVDPLGRRVAVKRFTDPVPASEVGTREGRISTVYFDELGRPRFEEVELGHDYSNEKLIVGRRTYDVLGRVSFEADPYPESQAPSTAYGTTQYFERDGSLWLSIRGRGPQPVTTTPDASLERFPFQFRHMFGNYTETTISQTADALTSGSPQFGVYREGTSTAVGRVMTRSTWRNGIRLEHAQLAYDRMGQLTRMIRYQDPAAGTNPVDWSWQFDSLGQVLRLDESTSAPQERSYSDWGELKEVTWIPAAPQPTHSVRRTYDALGRLIRSEEQNGGGTDAATVNTYRYDVPGQSAFFSPTYVLGQLASASAPTGDVVLSYDAYGNVNGRSFKRVVNGHTVEYIERHGAHGDGSQAWLELKLPDNNHQSERVDYAYDSAGRLRWMRFRDGADTHELYNATQVDAWGRLRSGLFGKRTEYWANYADLGRRLPQDVKVWSLAGTRFLSFTGFDAVGRETSRDEDTPTFSGTQNVTYDTLGRLKSTLRSSLVSGSSGWAFDYDAIGNIRYQDDLFSTNDTIMSYQTADRDRLCGINYFGLPIFGCTVDYDSFGNVVQANTKTGSNKLQYFNSGSVRRIENETGLTADFRYDAFGDVKELDITSGSTVVRSDRRFGASVVERTQKGPSSTTSYVSRQFPGPGLLISRRAAQR